MRYGDKYHSVLDGKWVRVYDVHPDGMVEVMDADTCKPMPHYVHPTQLLSVADMMDKLGHDMDELGDRLQYVSEMSDEDVDAYLASIEEGLVLDPDAVGGE